MKFLHLVILLAVGPFLSEIAPVVSEIRHDEITWRKRRSTESSSLFFYQEPQYPKDCKEVYEQCEGQSADGVYLIKPEGSPEPFEVYCNNSIDGGGWTVFQRRLDGSVDFYRFWSEYKTGFGFLRGDFWLGNDKISYLTNQKKYELRIDMNNVNGQPYFAKYNLFRISDEATKYRLVGIGDYDSSSTANFDAMGFSHHKNQSFSTRDRDNDLHNYNYAADRHGAWWFKAGYSCHLNGIYNAGSGDRQSMVWYTFPGGQYHLKYSDMEIRPLPEF